MNTTMTFFFSDIEGSTERWERSAEMVRNVEEHYEILRDAVARFHGEEFATTGDGLAASFSSAGSAVHAAIEAQRQMARTDLRVRIGVHTGEVHHAGTEILGRPINRAARIMAVGHGGQILLSELSAALVRSGTDPVDMVDLGTHRLRDLAEPERIWQVLDSELPRAFPPLRGVDTFSHNLPSQKSSFVGRDDELRRIVELLHEHRVVTLTGPGGVGKTRLSVHAAADALSDYAAVWFVELAAISDDDELIDGIGDTIAHAARIDPTSDPMAAIVQAVGSRQILLVLDNCEQIIEAAAAVAERLTTECPNLRILATSRESLVVDGEFVFAVRPLDPVDTARDLFRQRAAAAGAVINRSENPMVEQICGWLDGLPLAIELAAARVPALGLTELSAALTDRFNILAGGRRTAADRHRTLRATVDWSYRLLSSAEQRLVDWLSAFRGGFELDAVGHIARYLDVDDHAVADLVIGLVRKCMIEAEEAPTGLRYRMLETVRKFAADTLACRGEGAAAADAQADWVASVTDLPFADPCNKAVENATLRLERESENWRQAISTALHSSDEDLAARLCGPSTAFFVLGRSDLRDVLPPLLPMCSSLHSRRAVVCSIAAASAGSLDAGETRRWSDELRRLTGDESRGIWELIEWVALSWSGDFDAAVRHCIAAMNNPHFTRDTRDLFCGIATSDRFGKLNTDEDRERLAQMSIEAAGRTTVRLQRVVCLIGASWALLPIEPSRSVAMLQQALAEIPWLPAFLKRTLPGSGSRLMTHLDPRLAAADLLKRIEEAPVAGSTMDLIPISYASALLCRVGHPAAGPALATLAASAIAPSLVMMGFDGLAREAAMTHDTISLDELHDSVKRGLSPAGQALWTLDPTVGQLSRSEPTHCERRPELRPLTK